MSVEISTVDEVTTANSARDRAVHWLLVQGNRFVLAGVVALALALALFSLVRLGLLAVGPNSPASTAFASGLVSGMVTLLTVALSINQLILSRVFGSPSGLAARLDGTRDLRNKVRIYAGEATTPNDPAEFMSLTAATLAEYADRLDAAIAADDWDPPPAVIDYLRGVRSYGESVDETIESQSQMVDVLDVILGSGYAHNITATEHVANRYADELSPAAHRELAAVDDLLEAIAVSRQFFKTMALQQNFARLSRVVAYSGLAGLAVSLGMALLYRTNSVTVASEWLPFAFAAGVAVIVFPVAVFIAYVVRAATIAHETVSVGPFVPPQERGSRDRN